MAVTLTITADSSALRKEIDDDIRQLGRLAAATDKTNAGAVASLRENIAAQRDYARSVGASEVQLAQLDKVERQLTASVDRARAAIERQTSAAREIEKVSPGIRTGARALDTLAIAADTGRGNIRGLTTAAGMLTTTLGEMSGSAALAASASGFGALVMVLGTVIGLLEEADAKAAKAMKGVVTEVDRKYIGNLGTVAQAGSELTAARGLADNLEAKRRAAVAGVRANIDWWDPTKLAANAVQTWYLRHGLAETDVGDRAFNARARANAIYERYDDLAHRKEHKPADTARQEANGLELVAAAHLKVAKSATERYELEIALIARREAKNAATRGVGRARAGQIAAYEREALDVAAAAQLDGLRDGLQKARDAAPFAQKYGAQANELTVAEQREIEQLNKLTLSARHYAEALDLVRSKYGALRQNMDAERRTQNQAFGLQTAEGSDNAGAAFRARLQLIERERAANVRAGIDGAAATARAEQAKRALIAETTNVQLRALATIEQATAGSHARGLAAAGSVARAMRRVILGYEAADATVKGAKEGAAALGALARWDPASAALHGASSVQYFAAAAAAAAEGGQGRGGGGGGGGAGGGGGGMRDSSRLNASVGMGGSGSGDPIKLEILVVQQAPDGRELSRTRQQLQRLDDRNQPVRMSV